ncbi:uncharacterized protein BDV17DRAFT_74515 [Aspergillus undulatus]|uniref:uncharacterized protein n=1 Tax=Aspergillus undulatus TaxID=1810928 RepID=UPI003CCD8F46
MGQYWLVACPSEKEYAECLFAMKLGEMLFSSWPEFLVSLLLRKPSNISARSSSSARPLLSPRDPWVGRWAGEPILCVGDYLKPGDLPIMEQHGDLGIDTSLSLRLTAKNAYNDISDLPESWLSITRAARPCGRVLRNLTTKEYVREDGLAGGITLGHIVLLQICWSSDPSTSIQGGKYLARGEWAGHLFDIVPLRTVELEWIDQTEKLWNDVDNLWKYNFGEDWEESW